MPKVYPNAAATSTSNHKSKTFPVPTKETYSNYSGLSNEKPQVLTIWKKSLLFNCDGFTVFDRTGNLVFRVDNYFAATKSEIILMDGFGNSLLTIRRKRLSISDNWLIYKGETTLKPIMSVKKDINLLNAQSLAHATNITSAKTGTKTKVPYEIEGSYARRCCTIYDENRKPMAEIKQKEMTTKGVAFGLDVFQLVVNPEVDSAISMALVIVLDQMFGSSRRSFFN